MNRLRRLRRNDEGGFALVFVMFVTTVIMMAVATTLAVTTPNITAAKQTQDVAGALVAAQSGIDDAVAYLTSVPQCRSQTRICPQAYSTTSASLVGTSYQRPTPASGQTFFWTLGSALTADGYVRVTSTGTSTRVNRTLVADLSLQPSILSYGYYSDYESQSPAFFDSYFTRRSVYIASSGRTATWNGAEDSASTGSPDSVCGQHYYRESSASPGRYLAVPSGQTSAIWSESGSYQGSSKSHTSACDLVFTTGMTENGKTYSRDALYVSYTSGTTGPIFRQPVYTMWGYSDGREDFRTPSVGGQPWRGQSLTSSSTYHPVIAPYDLTLPATIGTDGLADDSCVYDGPTRVRLNGDGTATVTSPETTSVHPGSDRDCYPSSLTASGIVGFTLNYARTGSGTIYVKNLNEPSGDWPQSSLTSQSAPSPTNEIFWFPSAGGTTTNPNTRTDTEDATYAGCTTSVGYAATAGAACAWTGVATNTDATSSTGWTTYNTANTCSQTNAATNRQLFECEYSQTAANRQPTANRYLALRTLIRSDVTAGSCLAGTSAAQATCLTALVNARLRTANSGQKAFNATTFRGGDHRYVATATPAADAVTATTVGAVPTSTGPPDALLASTPNAAARESHTTTPITVTVSRQTYSNSRWGSDTPQFTFTVSPSIWAFAPATGAKYFPNPDDVTTYDTGATSSGDAAGSNGSRQPGDVYLEGVNKGPLSVIADNNVEITGNVTNTSGDTSTSDPLSITAGQDIRNYHPVSCVDQTADDIDATTPGFCPNDITGLTSYAYTNSNGTFQSSHPAVQYTNILGTGDRTIDAALFTLTGSLRTENYDRAVWVGNLTVNGACTNPTAGANGVNYASSGTPARSGTSLQYNYVDLERANLPYAPPASNSANPRPWNVVSISAGS